jgi:hypothetical protein
MLLYFGVSLAESVVLLGTIALFNKLGGWMWRGLDAKDQK